MDLVNIVSPKVTLYLCPSFTKSGFTTEYPILPVAVPKPSGRIKSLRLSNWDGTNPADGASGRAIATFFPLSTAPSGVMEMYFEHSVGAIPSESDPISYEVMA